MVENMAGEMRLMRLWEAHSLQQSLRVRIVNYYGNE